MMMKGKTDGQDINLAVEGGFSSLSGATEWLNSPPLSPEGLKGKVVLIDFWTYSCINCLRSIPFIRAWSEKYKDHGLVVIGVHAPEFAFERNISNVRAAVSNLKIQYPVAIDNDYKIWRAFDNEYWPAHYFIDAQGQMRYHHFGEGEYDVSERVLQRCSRKPATRTFRAASFQSTQPAPSLLRAHTTTNLLRLTSAITAPTISSRLEASSRTNPTNRWARPFRSINGAYRAIGRSKMKPPLSMRPAVASSTASTPATSISYSGLARTENP
jgi:thiol-disulfide isomerase/thioredoxin